MAREKKSLKSAKAKEFRFQVFLNVFFIALSIIFLYPIYYQLVASLSNPNLLTGTPLLLFPKGFTTEVYKVLLGFRAVWTGYKNSLINLGLYVSIALVATMGAAYALSRSYLIGKKYLMIYFTIPMFLSGGLIPTFVTIRNLGLYNTRWAVILPGMVALWNMLMARSFLAQNIPMELYESAVLDGAGETKFFCSIVLPLSKAIMAVLILYYGAGSWNSYFAEMIYFRDRELYNLQLILREMLIYEVFAQTSSEVYDNTFLWQESLKYAVTIVAILPLIILFPFVQKYFVKGVMVGSLKG